MVFARDDYNAALVDFAWSAWAELGVAADKRSHSRCAIDLELLVAFTEHLDDPRLLTEAERALVRLKPYLSSSRLVKARRLLPVAIPYTSKSEPRRRPALAPLRLRKPSLIQLRLRAIFGNSARSEILLALLLKQPEALSLSEIADRSLLVKSIVSKTADEMREAGVLSAVSDRNRLRFTIAESMATNSLVGMLPTKAPDWSRIFRMLLAGQTAFAQHNEASISLAVDLTNAARQHSNALFESLPRGSDGLTRARISRAWVDAARAIAMGDSPELNIAVTRGFSFDVDGLTGLLNRRAVESHLSQILSAPEPAAFIMVDVDHFKTLNDTYGHMVGDGVLTQIGNIIAEQCAEEDSAVACRYGGEEFLIAINCEPAKAEAFAELLRAAIATHKFVVETNRVTTTVSIGVATSEADRESLGVQRQIERADAALYSAKIDRNRVVVASF